MNFPKNTKHGLSVKNMLTSYLNPPFDRLWINFTKIDSLQDFTKYWTLNKV